jgi:hypothetical protein
MTQAMALNNVGAGLSRAGVITCQRYHFLKKGDDKINMNKTQRLILAVIVPLFVLSIAGKIVDEVSSYAHFWSAAFDMEDVWWVWVITFAVIGVFEFFLFRDRKKDLE